MLRLVIVDQDGKLVLPQKVATAAELVALAEQAKGFIRECERLAQQKAPASQASRSAGVPYLS